MNSSQDTEITLGTTKLLGLFFGLVALCAVFFALGYSLGRKSDAGLAPAAAVSLRSGTVTGKPTSAAAQPAQPMTFYKAVEQKDANAQLTPATSVAGNSGGIESSKPANDPPPAGTQPAAAQPSDPPDPMAPVFAGAYFVQVAAVSKQEDAQALVDALKQKQYPAFVASNSSVDKLFRVQLGPFGDIKEAEGMRSRLIDDGYNPILKK
jgi:DedD protein